MQHSSFLQDLAVVLLISGVVTVLFNRFKQPIVLGYIIAGFIVGPYTPPFSLVKNVDTVNTLAELGIVFLMFSLGLEFSFTRLKSIGLPAFITASLEISGMIAAGYFLGTLLGWDFMDSLFLGGILAISSTTIIIKALGELKATREKFSQFIFGILIIEDILGILIIAILSSIATKGALDLQSLTSVIWKLGVFLAVVFVGGVLFIPRILSFVSKFKNSEMLLITSLALCFGISYLASAFEYSVALGAFLVGAIIAETKQARQIEALNTSLRDMFGAVFFVSVGMLINPRVILDHAGAILIISLLVVVGKVLTCTIGAFITGSDRSTALKVGLGLAQIGEFSFIIAALGISKEVTSDFLYPIAVAVSAITTLTTPYFIKNSNIFANALTKILPRRILELADSYTATFAQSSFSGSSFLSEPYVKRSFIQIPLNLLLLSAVFSGAAWIAKTNLLNSVVTPSWHAWKNAILWSITMLVTLPSQIVMLRRIVKTARVIAEHISVERPTGTAILRSLFSFLVSTCGILLYITIVFAFSTAFLPPLNILLILAGILVVVTLIFRNKAADFYQKWQQDFETTLSHDNLALEGSELHAHADTILPVAVELFHFFLADGSPLAGRHIKDIELRKSTGASIVSIERSGTSIVSPSPDEILLAGDDLILLGNALQLEAARQWLSFEAK